MNNNVMVYLVIVKNTNLEVMKMRNATDYMNIQSQERVFWSMCEDGEVEYDIDKNIITGKTFEVKEFIKKNFNAKWDSVNKGWTPDNEIHSKENLNNIINE
jgi:hypothetical protein